MSCASSCPPKRSLLAPAGIAAAWLLGVALLVPDAAQAESLTERMTRLALAGDERCADPWTYSRGLQKCICIKAGYSKQWGKCLPMEPDLASDRVRAGRAAIGSALPAPETTGTLSDVERSVEAAPDSGKRLGDVTARPKSRQAEVSSPKPDKSDVETPPAETPPVETPPVETAPPETELAEREPRTPPPMQRKKSAPKTGPVATDDLAARMEKIARAQDCLGALDLYDGPVDGQSNTATVAAYRRFAAGRGLPLSDKLMSRRAQTALRGACGERWARAKVD